MGQEMGLNYVPRPWPPQKPQEEEQEVGALGLGWLAKGTS